MKLCFQIDRIIFQTFLLFLASILVGCNTPKGVLESKNISIAPNSGTNISLLKTNLTIAQLNAIANDKKRNRFERGKAVCSIFANYVKPGMDSASVQKILKKAKWLEDAEVGAIYSLAGWIPIHWEIDADIGTVSPFKSDDRGWIIWLALAPTPFIDPRLIPRREKIDLWYPAPRERGIAELETIAFLSGAWKMEGNPTLREFTISYPYGYSEQTQVKRDENFTEHGLIIYPDSNEESP